MMKFVVGIFIAVFTVVSAAPFDSTRNDLTAEDFDDFLTGLAFATEEDVRGEDVQNHLKDRLEYILEKIKEALDDGKSVKEDLLTKLKEIRAKLKAGLGEEAKELLRKIKESGRNYLKNFLKGLGLSKRDIEERSEAILENEKTSLEEVQKQLKERLDEVLKKIKDAIDQGKAVKSDMLKKMKELQQKMKDMNLEVGNKSKAILEKIKEKGREILKDILEKLGLGQKAAEEQADAIMLLAESESIHINNLKEKFNELIERVKGKLEGSRSNADILEKAPVFHEELRNLNFGIMEKFKKIYEHLKEKINGGNEEFAKFKEMFEQIVLNIKQSYDEGEGISEENMAWAQDYYENLKILGVKVNDKILKIYEDLKNKMNQK